MRRFLILMALLALVPFAFAACGGDDEEEPVAETTTEEPSAEPSGGGGGEGSTVELAADPGGSLEYVEDSASAEAGAVTISFVNESPTPHDTRIEGSDGEDLGGTEVISGETAEATLELEPGEYTFYCSVAGHREAGMEGTLTVE